MAQAFLTGDSRVELHVKRYELLEIQRVMGLGRMFAMLRADGIRSRCFGNMSVAAPTIYLACQAGSNKAPWVSYAGWGAVVKWSLRERDVEALLAGEGLQPIYADQTTWQIVLVD